MIKKGGQMKRFQLAAGVVAMAMGAAGSAHAALLGVVQTFPDITFTSSPYLIYDHNGANATTGRLRIVTGSTTLNEGAAAGGTTLTQSYYALGDSIPDLMLTIDVNNSTGAFVNGSVSIGFGNTQKFSWTGAVTNFGFLSNGASFDATWNVGSDQYVNMPATLSQFVNGYLTGGTGGIKIANSNGVGGANIWAADWIRGTAATTNPNLTNFTGGLTTPNKTNSTVSVDVFATPVPLPGAVWLLGSGLAVFAPIVRRRNTRKPAC